MRSFDFYEFTGILIPGSITIVAILLLFPQSGTTLSLQNVTLGDLGLIVILAYAAGHITQAVGDGVEWVLWTAVGGMPTDWVRTKAHPLLADEQIHDLQAELSSELNIQTPIDPAHLSSGAWYDITRQIYAAVAAKSRNGRVDTFNGNYGLSRGIASALLIGLILLLFVHGLFYWQIVLLILIGAGVALYRTYHFGVIYARELFVQFLPLARSGSSAPAATEETSQIILTEVKLPEEE